MLVTKSELVELELLVESEAAEPITFFWFINQSLF